jgi:hypothetical protein
MTTDEDGEDENDFCQGKVEKPCCHINLIVSEYETQG